MTLAYVFWHRPAADADAYERQLGALHRSFAAHPPVGLQATASLRADDLPWLGGGGPGYEDWYLVDDWTALGVLRESALGSQHRASHDRAARLYREGAAGVYRLSEGHALPARSSLAVWVDAPARGQEESDVVALLLADGSDGDASSLWRRELVLGPAPEYCLLTDGDAPGVAPGRLPADWLATRSRREAIPMG